MKYLTSRNEGPGAGEQITANRGGIAVQFPGKHTFEEEDPKPLKNNRKQTMATALSLLPLYWKLPSRKHHENGLNPHHLFPFPWTIRSSLDHSWPH